MALKKTDLENEQQPQKEPVQNEATNTAKLQEDMLKIITELQNKTNDLEARLKSANSGSGHNQSDINALAEAIKSLNKKVDDIDYNNGIDESKIPVDDILEKKDWITFCVPKAGYTITDDIRSGHIVKLPFGKKLIWFEFIHMNRAQAGKHTVTTPIATYTCKSKAEREWIKKHSLYGTLIFESTKQAMNTDAEKAMRLATVIGLLKSKELPEIVAESRQFNLPFIAENVEQMRHNLAIAIVERERDKFAESESKRAHEVFEASQMISRMM